MAGVRRFNWIGVPLAQRFLKGEEAKKKQHQDKKFGKRYLKQEKRQVHKLHLTDRYMYTDETWCMQGGTIDNSHSLLITETGKIGEK